MFFVLAALILGIYVLSPLVVLWTYRFASHCRPVSVSFTEMPEKAAHLFLKRIPELQELGFEVAGCFDCGCLVPETHSYVTCFRNRGSGELADVSMLVSPRSAASYMEFSSSFANGLELETNTNEVLPLTPSGPDARIFRFPEITDARALLAAHRQIVEKYASGLRPRAWACGTEIERLVRVIENYGPRHSQIGYMRLMRDGERYQLTWKGAFLMTWRRLWPVSFVRRWVHRHAMNSELHSLANAEASVLHKA